MAETFKDKVAEAVTDTAKNVNDKIYKGAEKDTEFVPVNTSMGCSTFSSIAAGIKERMDVIASCGTKVGVVDRVEGGAIKLTRNDSADGMHHFIPTEWVQRVDRRVHLKKNPKEAEQGWKSDAASCGCS